MLDMLEPRERLIVALDCSSVPEAEAVVDRLGGAIAFYKIGYQLAFAGGLEFAKKLVGCSKRVFIDLNLLDVGAEVSSAVESIGRIGATFLTVHAYPQTMHAAVEARAGSNLRILAVPVPTSYSDADLAAAGYDFTVQELIAERAAQAKDIGIDGIVCAPTELTMLRSIVGPRMILVAAGIRPIGSEAINPNPSINPAEAISAGANFIVVDHAILDAEDPRMAADRIVEGITRAQKL